MSKKITYEDKIAIQNDESVSEINKVTDTNMNEIKEVVNYNADEQIKQKENILNLEEKETEQDTQINTLQEQITELENQKAELQEQIEELETRNEQLENQIPPGKEEGNPIYLSDSSDLECEITVQGNSVQDGEPTIDTPVEVQTVGQNINLFDKDNANIVSLYFSNTGDTNLVQATKAKSLYIECKPNTTYTIQKISGNVLAVAYTEEVPVAGGTIYGSKRNDGRSISITTGENAKYLFVYYNNGSESVTDEELLDSIKIEIGATKTTYSSYNQGSIEVELCNKNILDLTRHVSANGIFYGNSCEGNNVESNYVELTPIANWSYISYKMRCIEENTDYTVSAKFLETIAESSKVGIIAVNNDTGTNIKSSIVDVSKDTKTTIILTFNTKEYTNIGIKFYANYTATNVSRGNSLVEVSEIQLERGLTSTTYKEYEGQIISIPTQKEFVKIGDGKDTFIKQDGVWYEKHLIKKVSLSEVGAYTKSDSYSDDTYFCGFLTNPVSNALASNGLEIMCNKLPIGSYSTTLDKECIRNNSQLHIRILASRLTENSASGLATYLTENPIIVYYRMKEPELIECTEEQIAKLEELQKVKTYRNITNIGETSIANLKVKYKQDLKSYIDNKINTLATAIVNNS